MAESLRFSEHRRAGTPLVAMQAPRIPVIAFGLSLGIFFVITYVLCVGFDLLFPGQSEMPAASAAVFAGSAFSAEVTSTQSRADNW